MSNLKSDLICFVAGLVIVAFFLVGCGASFFSAKTTATYTLPDGKVIVYESNKEQQGLDVILKQKDGQITDLRIHVDKASTAEQAIAAALAVQVKLMEMLERLAPLIEKAALAGS